MDIEGTNTPFRCSDWASFDDQHFLLNFIMSTYLGPDVYSDNPRCSAFQRLAKRLPPYTSNNLGPSFLSISQLESLYYYVLRNANPLLVLKPNMFYVYLKGSLQLPSSGAPEDHRQFTSFFPLNLHGHKRYSGNYEIVKGIVLIDDPLTSSMKEEDLERFRHLSGLEDLRIDARKCLSYQHGHLKGGEETESTCLKHSDKEIGETISNGKDKSSAMFGQKYRRRRCCSDLVPVSALPSDPSKPEQHNDESASEGPSNLDGSATSPVITLPKFKDCISDESIVLTGAARNERVGPQVGLVDIGISKAAYFFQVALPGVRRDFCMSFRLLYAHFGYLWFF